MYTKLDRINQKSFLWLCSFHKVFYLDNFQISLQLWQEHLEKHILQTLSTLLHKNKIQINAILKYWIINCCEWITIIIDESCFHHEKASAVIFTIWNKMMTGITVFLHLYELIKLDEIMKANILVSLSNVWGFPYFDFYCKKIMKIFCWNNIWFCD